MSKSEKLKSNRYIPLDIVRGLTVVLMIFCNNLGSNVPSFMHHAEWNGFQFADIVFPSFVFCLGLSLFFALKKVDKISLSFTKKVIIRFIVLFAIELVFNILGKFFDKLGEGMTAGQAITTTFGTLRITGVFLRLALISLITPFIIILCKKNLKIIIPVIVVILLTYSLVLSFNHGYENSSSNIIHIIDNAIFTPAHSYKYEPVDPEGLFSTLPCIAHALIGFTIGKLIIQHQEDKYRLLKLIITGASFIVISLLLNINYFIPINKKIWTASFVFFTSGISCLCIALFDFAISFEKLSNGFIVLKSIGCNALFIYIFSSFIGILVGNIPISPSLKTINDYFVYEGLKTICMNNLCAAEIINAILRVGIVIPVALILNKKKIYIKL